MKILLKRSVIILIAAALFGCGNATEVGNPTGDIPTLQTIEGVIDTSNIQTKSVSNESLDPTILTVVATASGSTTRESAVDVDGSFSIQIEAGISYAFDVRMLYDVVGPFSFEQDDAGNRSDRLEVIEAGDPIDLGLVRYVNGEFIPENEPRRQMGNGQN